MRPALEIGKFLLFLSSWRIFLSLEVNHARGIFRWAGFESWLKILSRGVGRRHPTSPPLFSPKAYCWLSPTICFYSSFCYCSTGASSRGWKTQTLCKPSKFREKKGNAERQQSKFTAESRRKWGRQVFQYQIPMPLSDLLLFSNSIWMKNWHFTQSSRQTKNERKKKWRTRKFSSSSPLSFFGF